MPTIPVDELGTLLRGLFRGRDLRGFVTSLGPDLVDYLPEPGVPLVELVESVCTVLRRRGQLDLAFFHGLTAWFPAHAADIAAVARHHGVLLPPPPREDPIREFLGDPTLAAIGSLFR